MKNLEFKLVPALLLLALAGCANTTTPHYDEHYGDAVRAAVAQQTINPDASKNKDPVAGMDGKAAVLTMDNYDKSFKTPEKAPTLSISIGGSSN